jgi:quinol monooxygenase YgiN
VTAFERPVFVTATATARPGAEAELKTLAQDLIAPNRAERGCLYYAPTKAPTIPAAC